MQLAGPRSGRGQQRVAEPQRVAGRSRRRVREERHHVDLGVPEVVAAVAGPGDALGRDAGSVGARGGLHHREEVPAHRLLHLRLARDLDVAPRPEVGEVRRLLGEVVVDPLVGDPLEGALAAVEQLARRDGVGGVVADGLGERDRVARLGLDPERRLREVVAALDPGLGLVVGADLVVGSHADRHPAVGAPEAERDPAGRLVALVDVGHQHPVAELGRLARVHALVDQRREHLGLAGAVLTVEQLGGDRHRRRGVEQGDLHRHHGQVALGEGDHPPGDHPHPLAAGRAPQQGAGQDAGAQVEGALVLLEVGGRDLERLVVDVEPDHLRVGRVDDRLADPGEPERLLGVLDRPGLVEAVDVGAVAVEVAALLVVAAQPEVAVAEAEQRLGHPEVAAVEAALHEPPLVDGEAGAVEGVTGRRNVARASGALVRVLAHARNSRGRRPRWSDPRLNPHRPAGSPHAGTTALSPPGRPRRRS